MRTPFAEFISYTKPYPERCPHCQTYGQRLYTEPGQTEEQVICLNRRCDVSPFLERGGPDPDAR